jgi:phenylalanyl-tRNA synthetase alpha chain
MVDVSTLHDLERKVLKALKKGLSSIQELIKETGLKEDQIRRALSWLKFKNLVKIERDVAKQIALTTLGKKYLKADLPETILLNLAKAKKAINDVTELTKDELNAALGVARSMDLINIQKGILNLTKKGEQYLKKDQKEILKLIYQGKAKLDDANAFIRRGIANMSEVKKTSYSLTNLGAKIAGNVRVGAERRFDLGSKQVFHIGKKQPYLQFMDFVKDKLVSLGFKEMRGNLIENEFWNMDSLFMPQFHSARDIHDVYYVKNPRLSKPITPKFLRKVKKAHEQGIAGSKGWNYKFDVEKTRRMILRSQGTSLSIRQLANEPEIPGKYFAMAKCFRYDVIDAQHLPDFYQTEGIVLGDNVNFKTLLGLLKMFAKEIAGAKKIKFASGYFPFTEPSVELFAYHPKLKWIELGGAGIFRPEVTAPFNVDVPVLAWGLGIDRLAMLKLGYKHIKDLYTTDLKKLRESKVII